MNIQVSLHFTEKNQNKISSLKHFVQKPDNLPTHKYVNETKEKRPWAYKKIHKQQLTKTGLGNRKEWYCHRHDTTTELEYFLQNKGSNDWKNYWSRSGSTD